jgi:hypothetical protein
MESLKSFHDHLGNLQHQARKLISAGLSLTELFAEQAKRLSREDEASRLRTSYRAVVEQLERAKRDEGSASYAQSQVNQEVSLIALGMAAGRAAVSKNNRLSTISDSLKSVSIKKLPFGNVLVCIGPKGLPEDVEVISISRLARDSKRLESDVIIELQKRGYLLLSKEAFSLLIDKLVDDVRKGRLRLPISGEKLSEIKTSSLFKPEAKKSEWVPSS